MTIASPPQATKPRPRVRRRAWKLRLEQGRLADLLPAQGEWTADDYLWLTRDTRRLIELADGWIEELPMPTEQHQRILGFLYRTFFEWLTPKGGIVLFSALRMRLAEQRFREPDLLVLLDAQDPRRGNEFWRGADLVVEVVSPSNAEHDLVTKRSEYAEARIPEYWIVDPPSGTVTVYTLDSDAGGAYREHGRFDRGEVVTSPLLPGLILAVDDVFTDL